MFGGSYVTGQTSVVDGGATLPKAGFAAERNGAGMSAISANLQKLQYTTLKRLRGRFGYFDPRERHQPAAASPASSPSAIVAMSFAVTISGGDRMIMLPDTRSMMPAS